MATNTTRTPIPPHSTNGKTSETGDQPTLESVVAV